MDQQFEHPTRTHGEPKFGPIPRKLLLLLIVLVVLSVIWTFFTTCNSALDRVVLRNNLNRIGLGFHNYHDQNESFPIVVSQNNTILSSRSWFFQILRHTEGLDPEAWSLHHPKLAWDDPQNRDFFAEVPDLATNPAISQTLNENGFGLIHYAANSQLFEFDRAVNFRDIKDGTSETLMVGEINSGFPPWGAPGNVRDPALGLSGAIDQFGVVLKPSVLFLMADGSTKPISTSIDPKILKALASPAGREEINQLY